MSSNERARGRTNTQKHTNRREPAQPSEYKRTAGQAQPSRDQVAGPSTSEHTTERAQTRWYEHEQGQERGERRRARGQVSEGNAAASSSENNGGGYNKCGGSSRSGVGAGAGTAAAGQGREREP